MRYKREERMKDRIEGVRLSQCMIVKNEEQNIRRALLWGKGRVCEQIVVDTGSTDRTVEIAKEMGARVYYFDWCDDFSAAKNYAIEQVSGDWIAFLDADEYFSEEDADLLMDILSGPEFHGSEEDSPHFLRCAWVQLGEDGRPFAVSVQDRIFRNIPQIRYHGRIHEQIALPHGEAMNCRDERKRLSIMHTGYVPSVMKERGKRERNVQLLLRELEENPDDLTPYSYLGDAYIGMGDTQRAAQAYEKALTGVSGDTVNPGRYESAGKSLLRIYAYDPSLAGTEETAEETAKRIGYPAVDNPDVWYYLGLYHMKRQDFSRAHDEIRRSLDLLDVYRGTDDIYLRGSLGQAYTAMTALCRRLCLPAEELKYAVLALRADRYQEDVLCGLLGILKADDPAGERTAGAWQLLLGIYDRKSQKDLLFLVRCIRTVGYPADKRQ